MKFLIDLGNIYALKIKDIFNVKVNNVEIKIKP